jgi:hypothetical protein
MMQEGKDMVLSIGGFQVRLEAEKGSYLMWRS